MIDTRWLTLLRLKRRLGVDSAVLSASDEARMESAMRAAQAEIEAATGRRFAPVQSTIQHWARPGETSLMLRDDLLELISAVDSDGKVYTTAHLTFDSAGLAFSETGAFAGGPVKVTGLWAYHPAPSLAFRPSGDALAASISSSAGSLTVSNASGSDTWGDSPRFAAGHLLRIGAELLRVTDVTGNTVFVRRGQNGTTAAAHSIGVGIEVYIPGFTAESLGLRLASWLYREADGEHGREWPLGIARGFERLRRVKV